MRILAVCMEPVCCYLAGCLVIAVALGEFALHPGRLPVNARRTAQTMAARFGARLLDISIFCLVSGICEYNPAPVKRRGFPLPEAGCRYFSSTGLRIPTFRRSSPK